MSIEQAPRTGPGPYDSEPAPLSLSASSGPHLDPRVGGGAPNLFWLMAAAPGGPAPSLEDVMERIGVLCREAKRRSRDPRLDR